MTLIRYPLIDNSGPEWDVLTGFAAAGVGINTVMVDTGQLAAGLWEIISGDHSGEANAALYRVSLQHRNAANTANVNEYLGYDFANGRLKIHIPKAVIAQDERFRVFAVTATNAVYHTPYIFFRRLNGDI